MKEPIWYKTTTNKHTTEHCCDHILEERPSLSDILGFRIEYHQLHCFTVVYLMLTCSLFGFRTYTECTW